MLTINRNKTRLASNQRFLITLLGRLWVLSFLWLGSTILLSTEKTSAAELTVDESDQMEINRIKSAYLYNFLKYIDFPESNEEQQLSGFKVCVLGQDPFGIALDGVAGRRAKGKPVIIQRLESLGQVDTCHILYISQSEEANLSNILRKTESKAILTVSDIPDFVVRGGMVAFVSHQQIRLEINLNNVQRSNIKISALLLEIAKLRE
ncbi:YfiR family protein [Aliikangiella marina]|uniref:YfiR family protein n=1 Tax=Aliikangiella marina TaxID=1712262 RepID=UPI00163D4765|nr:YfiR family protein [Aliikangiella marina]